MRVSKFLIGVITVAVLGSGCSSSAPADKPVKQFLTTTRQLAPEPVYNRVTMARPPEVLPVREVMYEGAPRVLPVIHLDLKGVTLETVAQTLAGSARYRSYCAAAIANRKFSIDALGTIDELADSISKKANVYVSVDHVNREVRFLQNTKQSPRLYTGDAKDTSKGTNVDKPNN